MRALARLVVVLCFAVALCLGGGAMAATHAAPPSGEAAGLSGHGAHMAMIGRTGGDADGAAGGPAGRRSGLTTVLNGDCHDAASHCCAASLPCDVWQVPAHAPCPMRRGSARRAAVALNLPEPDLPPPRV